MNRTRIKTSLVVALAAGCTLGLVGCGTEVTDEPDAQPDPAAAADGQQASPQPEAQSGPATLGDSITLETFEESDIQVTPVQIRDPARSSNQFIEPDPGNRYVGIRVRIRNTGNAPYDDSPSNGAAVIDAGDVEWDASVFDAIEPALGSVRIAPGDARVGWITFEVGQNSRLRTFQFSTNSGFGNSGEWRLTGN